MDLAFYTCFYGSDKNPAFNIPPLPSLKYKCYYFTNNKTIYQILQRSRWIPIFDDKPTQDDIIESCMIAKHIKVLPHQYQELKDYTYLCFLDSKLAKLNESFIEKMINEYFVEKNYALLLREHWLIHNSVWDEFDESMFQERYEMQGERYDRYIRRQIKKGLSEETEHHCACGLLIRNMKHEKINELNEMWYEHIQECGIQDQISFFFVKQYFMDYILSFTEDPFLTSQ